MARSFVPSPPDSSTLNFLLSSQASNWNASQSLFEVNESSNVPFGGEGFYDHINKGQDKISQLPLNYGFSQTVPQSCDQVTINSLDDCQSPAGVTLHSVLEIPEQYRGVFSAFSTFNYVQSRVFNDVLYSDNPLVTSAPTGSGKTVLFELAIVRLLMKMGDNLSRVKIVYVAPIKALCAERYDDWNGKFGPLGLHCSELTGDSQLDDYFELQNAHIIMTTPIHQLNDTTRGPTMEAIVCRMKTVRASVAWERGNILDHPTKSSLLRFIAVSATVPNIDDVAIWLGSTGQPAITHCISDSHRPVQLRRIVLSYPRANTDFKFDLSLNYKLSGVIQCYSDHKPTLVFCATRKGTQQAAAILVKDARFIMDVEHKRKLQSVAAIINDNKLRDLVSSGVGFHHAGMTVSDRKTIESIFYDGQLPVLFATSTLAMGVNLPAHLVIIKSTMHYANGMFEEYSESQILQMIGRAGRPQFDTSATAVIMTRNSTRNRYEALLGGTQLVESNLHSHLIEHLNAEIVLQTITDVSIALDWLKSTFLFTRIRKNPKHYGISEHVSVEELQEKLQEMCLQNLKELEAVGLLTMDDGFTLIATDTGRLMARYYVAFESMKRFLRLKNCDNVSGLVEELSNCKEFEDVHLRVSEKRVLNQLNKDKHRQTIRFPMAGKIKSTDMKVNCLIQATLGCLSIQEFSLNQDSQKIFRSASRLSKCLMEVQMLESSFSSLLGSVLLHKCISAKLWENSHHVAKQLDKIGVTLSTTLVNARLTSFDKIMETNARELELIVNRHPPFGNQVKEAASKMPKYTFEIEQSSSISTNQADLSITVTLVNYQLLSESGSTTGSNHLCILIIGDDDNVIVLKQKINDSQMLATGKWSRRITVVRARKGIELKIHLISLHYVGIDFKMSFIPRYLGYIKQSPETATKQSSTVSSCISDEAAGNSSQINKIKHPCNHRCLNKTVCGHDCCKFGLQNGVKKVNGTPSSHTRQSNVPANKPIKNKKIDKMYGHLDKLHQKGQSLPSSSNIQRLKVNTNDSDYSKYTMSMNEIKQFEYTPKRSMKCSNFESWSCSDLNSSSSLTTNDRQISNGFDNLDADLTSFSETDWNQFEYSTDDNNDHNEVEQDEWPPTPSPLPPSICQQFDDSSVDIFDDLESNNLFDYEFDSKPGNILSTNSKSDSSYYSSPSKRMCIRNDNNITLKRTPLAVLNQPNECSPCSPCSSRKSTGYASYNAPHPTTGYNQYSSNAVKQSWPSHPASSSVMCDKTINQLDSSSIVNEHLTNRSSYSSVYSTTFGHFPVDQPIRSSSVKRPIGSSLVDQSIRPSSVHQQRPSSVHQQRPSSVHQPTVRNKPSSVHQSIRPSSVYQSHSPTKQMSTTTHTGFNQSSSDNQRKSIGAYNITLSSSPSINKTVPHRLDNELSSSNEYTSHPNITTNKISHTNSIGLNNSSFSSTLIPQNSPSYSSLKENSSNFNRNKNIQNFFAVPTKTHHGQCHTSNSHLSSSEDDHDIYGTVFAGIF